MRQPDYASRNARHFVFVAEGRDPETVRQRVAEGLDYEIALATALMKRGIGFEWPSKRGDMPDLVDFVVGGEDWSVKGSTMLVPHVKAAQIHQPATRYIFLGKRGSEFIPLGQILAEDFKRVAWLVAKGELVRGKWAAHYDQWHCGLEDVGDLVEFLDGLAPQGRGNRMDMMGQDKAEAKAGERRSA